MKKIIIMKINPRAIHLKFASVKRELSFTGTKPVE